MITKAIAHLSREPLRWGGVVVALALIVFNGVGWITLGTGELVAVVGVLLPVVEGARSQVTPTSKL